MAQNQAQGGNSMAAMLGNMQNRTQRPGAMPTANYGAGMQAPIQGITQGPMSLGNYQPGGQAPIPPGGAGYPQMSPAAMQNMMGQISQRQKVGGGMWGAAPGQAGQPMQAAPGTMPGITQGPASLGQWPQAGQMPRRPMGAPGMGAGGQKGQQIAQLPGGPGMVRR